MKMWLLLLRFCFFSAKKYITHKIFAIFSEGVFSERTGIRALSYHSLMPSFPNFLILRNAGLTDRRRSCPVEMRLHTIPRHLVYVSLQKLNSTCCADTYEFDLDIRRNIKRPPIFKDHFIIHSEFFSSDIHALQALPYTASQLLGLYAVGKFWYALRYGQDDHVCRRWLLRFLLASFMMVSSGIAPILIRSMECILSFQHPHESAPV